MQRHAHRVWPSLIAAACLAMAWAWAQEPSRDDQATPPVERVVFDWDQSVDNLRVLDLEGRDIDVVPQREAGRISLSVPAQEPFVVKSDTVETRRLTSCDLSEGCSPGAYPDNWRCDPNQPPGGPDEHP